MKNKLLIAIVMLFGFVFADTAMDVNVNGLYVAYSCTINVSTTPVLVTPSISWFSTPNTIIQPFLAMGVIVVPQVTQNFTDVWYDTQVAGNGISTNKITTVNNVMWKPVGAIARDVDYRKNILYPSNGDYGINGVVLYKGSGSAVVGVQFLSKPRQ